MMLRRLDRARRCIALALVAGCGAGDLTDVPPGPDAPGATCSTTLTRTPLTPTAGDAVRVRAQIEGSPGVHTLSWSVTRGGSAVPYEPAVPNDSEILFTADPAGIYDVRVDVTGPGECPDAEMEFNVRARNAIEATALLRVTPPASSGVPPLAKTQAIYGGADFTLGPVVMEPGFLLTGRVLSGTIGVPAAYLRFASPSTPEAAVEVFADANGGFTARLTGQPRVLVIPGHSTLAPRLVDTWPPTTIHVGAGTAVTGAVLAPGGAPLGFATVQLRFGLVPSTFTVAGLNGEFTLRAEPAGGPVTVDVTPSIGSGLPRLTGTGPQLDVAQPVQVRYAGPAPVIRELAGTILRRGGVPLGAARVVVVGRVDEAGTIAAGGVTIGASGVIRVVTTTTGSGALQSARVPARSMAVVVELADGSHAVTSVDLTASAPAVIDIQPAVLITTQLQSADGAPIAGATLDAVPSGDLALAGVTSTIRATSGTNGVATAHLAAGGLYDLYIRDPLLRRGAQRVVRSVSPSAIAANYALSRGLIATGRLLQEGSAPLGGAAIQLFSGARPGELPLAEGVSEPDGRFTLVVPDPGTTP